jgi:hypothetical protein
MPRRNPTPHPLQAALAACIATEGYARAVQLVSLTLEEASRTIRAIDAADVADGARLARAARLAQPPKENA